MNKLARASFFTVLVILVTIFSPSRAAPARADTDAITNPILFVTQAPIQADFTTIASVFGNHRADIDSVGRGGDLYIRYPDGTLKNLTQAAGYGVAGGFQGANAIAVRDPSVHWSGTKALFSMAIGAPTKQYEYQDYFFQIYQVTGLGKNDTPVITKIPNQPANVNNITPIYGTDERVIFTSDRPRDGSAHLYPQLDEYEEQPVVSGLWSLDPDSGHLFLMTHAPSGAFTPTLDSFGRVIFTRWDHLPRDQQADADRAAGAGYDSYGHGAGCSAYCTFNYAGEAADAQKLANRDEIFPEPRGGDQIAGTNLWGHTFNAFTPWQINEDGTAEETLNHLGRHELNGYIPPSLNDDPNLVEYYGQYARANQNDITNFLQVRQDPTTPTRYFGIDAPEFYTHGSGQVISINADPNVNPDTSVITYWTHPETASYTDNPSVNHSGHYRDPLPLTGGTVIVSHTSETKGAGDNNANYAFRLKTLVPLANSYWGAGTPLTNGIIKDIWWWSPDARIDFNGEMWELQPVEVVARAKPERRSPHLLDQEKTAIENAGVQVGEIQTWLVQNNLALLVSRDVTQRDDFDKQQPFNLRVPNGKQTLGAGGKVYTTKYFQLFQGDLIRGIGGRQEPREGRRILSQLLHDPVAVNVNNLANGATSSVLVAPDGSVAAFVPARRAMTWQTTDASGTGVVRERMWITFQPGEIRVCTSCHGVNDKDQAGNAPATNVPQALTELMTYWKNNNGNTCSAKPTAPTQTSPGSGTTIPKRRAKLKWDAVTCATKYQIMVRESSPQGPKVEKAKNITATKYKTIKLNPATTYVWRVNACNAFGCAKSGWQTFTTP
ncbi:MAG: hypothetical protein IT331_22720 [Anaerolineae bacterium]|nr:hypothetical protein [Anaerolineae bacterium]